MIDVHCHVLPYLDDGAADWEASLTLARMASQQGIRQCIATPHWTGRPEESERLERRLEECRQHYAEANIPLEVHAGNEVVLVPKLVEALKSGDARTLAGSRYILLETAQLERGAYIQNALFQVQSNGYRVILAHPERVESWHHSLGDLQELLRRGCYLQVNAGSLAGAFGKGPQRAAERFLKNGWVSLLATDAHSPTSRPPLMDQAVARCEHLIGARATERLVEENPSRILCDELLPYIEYETAEQRPWYAFWKR